MRKSPTNPLIQEVLGEKHPIAFGWNLILQVHNFGDSFLTNGEESAFERPDSSKARDDYHLGVGRVLMIGDAAFKDKAFKDCELFPQVGDYIEFQKYEGTFKTYVGPQKNPVKCIHVKDYNTLDIVPDPSLCDYHHFIGN
jgi:hypothetical protein